MVVQTMEPGTRFTVSLSRRQCLRLLGLAVGGVGLVTTARAQNRRIPPPHFNRQSPTQDSVTIATVTGDFRFLVDIVHNGPPPESALKSQPPLARDEGVLYVVDVVRQVSLSNRGVPFATDILFITADGRIVQVEAEIMADDPAVFTSLIPVKAALQTIGGTVRRLDIRPGDHVLHPMFGRTL
jgi:uncharacterized protein